MSTNKRGSDAIELEGLALAREAVVQDELLAVAKLVLKDPELNMRSSQLGNERPLVETTAENAETLEELVEGCVGSELVLSFPETGGTFSIRHELVVEFFNKSLRRIAIARAGGRTRPERSTRAKLAAIDAIEAEAFRFADVQVGDITVRDGAPEEADEHSFGVFDVRSDASRFASIGVGDLERGEQKLLDRGEMKQAVDIFIHGLRRHAPNSPDWTARLEALKAQAEGMVDEAFAPPADPHDKLTLQIFEGVVAAFVDIVPKLKIGSMQALTGALMELANLVSTRVEFSSRKDRVRRAIARAQHAQRSEESPGPPL